jgi:hypothetical protein
MEPMKNEQIVFRCSKNLKEQMKHMARTQDLVLSDYIRNACELVMKGTDHTNSSENNLDKI